MGGRGGPPEPFKYPHPTASANQRQQSPPMSTDLRPVTHARIYLREMRDPRVNVAYIYTVGAFSIGMALFFEKSKLRALIWHKPDLSIIISNKVMTF